MVAKIIQVVTMLFCFTVFFMISNRIYSRRFNIVNIFNFLWCGGGILAVCGFFNLYEISGMTVLVICTISVIFSVAACSYSNRYVLANNQRDYLTFDDDVDLYEEFFKMNYSIDKYYDRYKKAN